MITVATLLLAFATATHAQTAGGFYIGGEAGWTTLISEPAQANVPVIGFRSDAQTWSDGFNLGVRAGYEWGPWRVEEEFRYQNNADRKLNGSGGTGDYTAAVFIANIIYDFALASPLSPHVGGGAGAVNLASRLHVVSLGQVITGSDWAFGYQAIGGVRYVLGPVASIDLDYRYLGTTPPRFRTGANFVDSGVPAPGLRVTSAYQSHSIVASLSLRFGIPPAR